MNYTKNHHLPQWVKDDRIMMDDFNQMCRDIESGIDAAAAEAKKNTDALSSKLESTEQAQAALKTRSDNSSLHMARQLLALRYEQADRSAFYSAGGVNVNPLSNISLAGTLYGAGWADGAGVYLGRGPAFPETILRGSGSSFTVATTSTDYKEVSATYIFTAPVTGVVRGFDLQYMFHFTATDQHFSGGRLTFTAEKRSGSSHTPIYMKRDICLEKSGSALLSGAERVEVNVPITKGQAYRFILRLDAGSGVLGRIGFCTWLATPGDTHPVPEDESRFFVTWPPKTSGVHIRTVNVDGTASRALVMIRYRREQASASLSASLADAAMVSIGEQEVREVDGQNCREAWFLMEANFSGSLKLRFDFSCGATDDFRMLGYAIMFL